MHLAVGAPIVDLNGTGIGVSGAIGLEKHYAGVNTDAHRPAKAHLESGRGPTAIGVVSDLGTCFIPQARVV